MNHLFAYFQEREHTFAAYLASLVNYHKKTGNLPHIPEAPLTNDDVAGATLPNIAEVNATHEVVVVSPQASNGFLFSLPNNVWPTWKHNCQEHADSLPAGADRDAAFANLTRANELWNVEGQENSAPLTCYPLKADGTLDIDHPILSTISWPSHSVKSQFDGKTYDTTTEAGVFAMCSPRPTPGPNPNAPPFPHPGG